MHELEPHYRWRSLYTAETDPNSPFYGRVYSEFEFSDQIYNYVIHPQWDNFGSSTLFLKILFADYHKGFVILEMLGEWNDCIHNDIMFLKRDFIDELIDAGINQFILIGENVLNFHSSDDCYYEEWFEDIEDGWIALLNFHDHVLQDMQSVQLDNYFVMGGKLEDVAWRTQHPQQLYQNIEQYVQRRLNPPLVV